MDRAGNDGDAEILRTRKQILGTLPLVRGPAVRAPTSIGSPYLTIERRRAAQLCQQPREGFAIRLERLNEMRAAAREVPLAVMIIPDVFQVEDRLWRKSLLPAPPVRSGCGQWRSPGSGWRRMGSPAWTCCRCCAGCGRSEDGETHVFKLNDTHFNARGNAVVGRALADFLERWPSGPGPAATVVAP